MDKVILASYFGLFRQGKGSIHERVFGGSVQESKKAFLGIGKKFFTRLQLNKAGGFANIIDGHPSDYVLFLLHEIPLEWLSDRNHPMNKGEGCYKPLLGVKDPLNHYDILPQYGMMLGDVCMDNVYAYVSTKITKDRPSLSYVRDTIDGMRQYGIPQSYIQESVLSLLEEREITQII